MKPFLPAPTGANNGALLEWARQVYAYLSDEQSGRKEISAAPIFLMHLKGGEKATTDGVMMYDPVYNQVVVSSEGAWKALAWAE